MVEYQNKRLDAIFGSLADPTRRDMLHRLRSRAHTVGELAARYKLTFAAVSKHLKVLERAGLVRKRRRGREMLVELSPQGLKYADEHLAQYRALWVERLDRLEAFVKLKAKK